MEKDGLHSVNTGAKFQSFIERSLKEMGYKSITKKEFDSSTYFNDKVYTKNHIIGISIYETKLSCNFIIYNKEKYPNFLVIETKWQQKLGTVDEKYPYWILNIKNQIPYKTIIVLDGGGYRKGAEKWVKKQLGGNLINIFNMREFQKWVNEGGL